MRNHLIAIGFAASLLLNGCGGGGGGGSASAPKLVGIELSPVQPSWAVGDAQMIIATGHFSEGPERNVSNQVAWSSSDPAVAAISNAAGSRGLATGLAQGTTFISASLAGLTATTTLTITDAVLVAIEVTPTQPTIAQGTALALSATGRYSDVTVRDLTDQVAWTSSDPAVAAISSLAGSSGLATGLAVGSSTISAELSGISGSTLLAVTPAVLVSIEVTPTHPSFAAGTHQALAATGIFSDFTAQDLTSQVAWASSDPAVAGVSNLAGSHGLALGVAAGSSDVTASFSGVIGSATLTITGAALASIDVSPTAPSIALGTTVQLAATGTFTDGSTQDLTSEVAWSSADVAIAGFSSSSQGMALGAGVGSTLVSASLAGVSGSTLLAVTGATLVDIEITPIDPSLPLGMQRELVATGTFSDSSTQDLTDLATWTSSNPAVAQVSNADGSRGLVTSTGIGSTLVSAAFHGLAGSATLDVTNATLTAIDVTPAAPSIALGTSLQLAATGIFSDGSNQELTEQVTWIPANAAVASVSNAAGSRGLALSLGLGNTAVAAHLSGVSGSTLLTVSNAALVSIGVTPASSTIALGLSMQMTATGTYTDGTAQDLTTQVTWTSANPAVVTVSNAAGSQGLADSTGQGSTLVSAALAGVSGSATLSVSGAVLVAIEVAPEDAAIAAGTAQQFTALGIYSDSSKLDVTTQVTWASADSSVAAISNAAGSHGLAVGLGLGDTTISAALAGVSGPAPLSVTSAVLVSIELSPFQPTLPAGTQVQFAAMGSYSDGSTQDLTAQATWTSSNALVAAISNVAGSHGLASAIGVGTATISVALGSVFDSTSLEVSSAVLVAIDIAPADPTLPIGMAQAFTATGSFSDGSVQDLTQQATWSSSSPLIAAVSNAAGSRGLATGVGVGVATISAAHSGLSGATSFTVTNAVLVSIEVDPADPTVPSGYKRRLSALGNFSDGSTLDLTAQVLWTSSATSVAKVSNAVGSQGRVTGVSNGAVTIAAALPGMSGSATLIVTSEKLSSIEINPSNVDLAVGQQQQLTAIGTFNGGTVIDITTEVNWTSSRKSVASVGNGATRGLLYAKSSGNATIKAKKGNKLATESVNVN